jgi:hypothetical protein
MKYRIATVVAFLSSLSIRNKLIALAVIVTLASGGTAIAMHQSTTDATFSTPPTHKYKIADKTQEKPEVVNSTDTVVSTPAPSPSPTSTTTKTPTPTPQANTKAPIPKPTPSIPSFSPTAIKYILQTGASTSFEPNRTVPIRLQFTYTVERDGSYNDVVGASPTYFSGPGQPGDFYCGGGISNNGNGGTAEIVVNYKALAGVYTCGFGTDLGYTRYETRYKVELTDTSLTVLPGTEIIPGRPI